MVVGLANSFHERLSRLVDGYFRFLGEAFPPVCEVEDCLSVHFEALEGFAFGLLAVAVFLLLSSLLLLYGDRFRLFLLGGAFALTLVLSAF